MLATNLHTPRQHPIRSIYTSQRHNNLWLWVKTEFVLLIESRDFIKLRKHHGADSNLERERFINTSQTNMGEPLSSFRAARCKSRCRFHELIWIEKFERGTAEVEGMTIGSSTLWNSLALRSKFERLAGEKLIELDITFGKWQSSPPRPRWELIPRGGSTCFAVSCQHRSAKLPSWTPHARDRKLQIKGRAAMVAEQLGKYRGFVCLAIGVAWGITAQCDSLTESNFNAAFVWIMYPSCETLPSNRRGIGGPES